MHKVLSHKLWKQIGAIARKSKHRQAAIAYVTTDLVGFKSGDLLIVDASEPIIRAAGTNAKLLTKLARKGVVLHSCPGLHAKVLLMDNIAVVGSGNMSASSNSALVEAAIMTDTAPMVSGVASLIEQLKRQSRRLDKTALHALSKIKVVRHGFGPGTNSTKHKRPKISDLGTRTWLVGVVEFDRELTASEQKVTDQAQAKLAKKHKTNEDSITWIRWTGKSPFPTKCQSGDQVIQIWRESPKNKRPSVVLRPAPLLLKERADGSTFVFIKEPQGKKSEIKWSAFRKLMKHLGYRRRFGPGSEVIVGSDLAEAISRDWNRF
jgi:hypothetical protein